MLRRAAILLAACSVLLVAACDKSGPAAGHVPANEWAASVCTTLAPWRTRISTVTADAQNAIGPDTSPQSTQTELAKMLNGASGASDQAQLALNEGAVPDVTGGEEIRSTVIAYLVSARDAYATAATTLSALDPAATDFYDQVAATMTQLNTAYAAGPDLTAFDSPELKDAFDTVPECR